jgi:hypothetical protein
MRVQPEEATEVTLRFFSIAPGVATVHFFSGHSHSYKRQGLAYHALVFAVVCSVRKAMGHFVRAYRDIHSGRATICPKTKESFRVHIFARPTTSIVAYAALTFKKLSRPRWSCPYSSEHSAFSNIP